MIGAVNGLPAFAIGAPGQPARWLRQMNWPGGPQVGLGEFVVAVEAAGDLPAVRIADDGASVALIEATLDERRADRRREARAYRDLRRQLGCTTPSGVIDTTQSSQDLIQGAASAAGIALALGIPFAPKRWTMADDTVVTLDARALVAVGLSVIAFMDDCQEVCRSIQDTINIASTIDAIDAIDITAGYRPI